MSEKLARRLVVTGHDGDGRSRVASDTVVSGEEVPGMPGHECSQIWGSDGRMHYPDSGAQPKYTAFFPPLDGCRLIETYLPANAAVTTDTSRHGEFGGAINAVMPGLADAMAKDRPGMHRTPTTDLIVVLEGRCILQLDEAEVPLNAGDLVIENGTIHGWLNPYDQPCRFLATCVGAKNDLCE